MPYFPKKLTEKLKARRLDSTLRNLSLINNLVDFSSNDYLGFSKEGQIEKSAQNQMVGQLNANGATGSRLLSGNHPLHEELEALLVTFFEVESGLLFNSGYDANIGFFSSIPQRGDIIFYDELVHASIRDGIKMSDVKAYKFKHNDLSSLKQHIERSRNQGFEGASYVVTESIFSMDGDIPDLEELATYCSQNGLFLIVDEAHATGVFGKGLLHQLKLQDMVFARIVTFSKALGCHGAAILGSSDLKDYLINYARSFIYTTALPPHDIAVILSAFHHLQSEKGKMQIRRLQENIGYFKAKLDEFELWNVFLSNESAIQIAMIPENDKVRHVSNVLRDNGFDVRPILSPTVPKGKERLRFCVHAYNTKEEIKKVLSLLKQHHNG